ncbi:dihydrofolate reductase [Streptomyces decoyicus]|uniref:dihydrofolate reductase family protein n=1 Tax=Streptomyces decoyicus TaxID=249567 RepID=UPI00340BB4CA
MRLLTYLVGSSADGFTAGPDRQCAPFGFDGDLKAAVLAEYLETVPGHARRPLGLVSTANRWFDTVVMGHGVSESPRAAGADSPYPWLRQCVLSSSLKRPASGVDVVAGDPAEFVRGLKRRPGMGFWLCGGPVLAGRLLRESASSWSTAARWCPGPAFRCSTRHSTLPPSR